MHATIQLGVDLVAFRSLVGQPKDFPISPQGAPLRGTTEFPPLALLIDTELLVQFPVKEVIK